MKKEEQEEYYAEFQKIIAPIFDIPAFVKFLNPFLINIHIQDEYKKFQEILKKIGIKTIEEFITHIIPLSLFKLSQETYNPILKGIEEKYEQTDINGDISDIFKQLSYEELLPYINELEKPLYQLLEETKKQDYELTEEEIKCHEYFEVYILKIWVRYALKKMPTDEIFNLATIKNHLVNLYFRRANELYQKEYIPQALIDYIDRIELETPKTKTGKEEQGKPSPNTFDYSNKEKYFFKEKIAAFKQIENNLLQMNYISSGNKWITEKQKLVAFIHVLYKLEYLKPRWESKTQRPTLLTYKRYFEKRYKITVSKAFQESQFDISRLKIYKADFHFIDGINQL